MPLGDGLLRRLKIGGELSDHREEVHVPQARVGRAVEGTDAILVGKDLERLVALGQRLGQHGAGRGGGETVHRVLAHLGQSAELREGPVVHGERAVAAHRQDQGVIVHPGRESARGMPPVSGLLLLAVAVVPERLHRRKGLIGTAAIQFVVGFREIRHDSGLRGKRFLENVKEQHRQAYACCRPGAMKAVSDGGPGKPRANRRSPDLSQYQGELTTASCLPPLTSPRWST